MSSFTSRALALIILGVAATAAQAQAYGAIAYSRGTGRYGASYGQLTRELAELVAIEHAYAEDATVKVWVRNGWASLAVGRDRSTGWAHSNISRADAENKALYNVSGPGARILCTVASGN